MTKRDQQPVKKLKKQQASTFEGDEPECDHNDKRDCEKKTATKKGKTAKMKRTCGATSGKIGASCKVGKTQQTSCRAQRDKGHISESICAAIKKFEESIKNCTEKSPEKTLESYFETFLKPFVPTKTAALASSAIENLPKNRTTHPCYDHTRVKLHKESKETYIHANLVEFEDIKKQYIMTQYPLPDDLEDFWTLAFENDVELIISIFNPMGDMEIPEYKARMDAIAAVNVSQSGSGKLTSRETNFQMSENQANIAGSSKRCALTDSMCYFPLLEGQYMTIGKYFVHTRKVELHDRSYRPTTYTVEVLPEGCSECKFIRVVNYPKWDKKKMPPTPRAVASLTRAIALDPLQKGPIIVHCDTGIDRSACFVMSDVMTKKVFDSKNVDIDEIFKKIRSQRAGCFQSSSYFVYAIYSSLHYIRAKCKKKEIINKSTLDLLNELLKPMEEKFKSSEEA